MKGAVNPTLLPGRPYPVKCATKQGWQACKTASQWDMAYIINGEKIEDSVIADEFESIKDHYQSMGEVVCCDRDEEFWEYARTNVINRTLLEQESNKRFGEVEDAAVDLGGALGQGSALRWGITLVFGSVVGFGHVRTGGLEPPCLSAPAPKAGASTSSATEALCRERFSCRIAGPPVNLLDVAIKDI